MQKYTDVVTSARSGAAIPDARVLVKTHPGAVDATIYSDDGVTTKANPIETDSNGEFSFYAADGDYTLTVSGTGITERTVGPITLLDPNDSDESTLPSTDVSFTPSGSGAVSDSSQGKHRRRLDAFDFIPTALHDGIRARTNTTDLGAYIIAGRTAAKAQGKAFYWPNGYYYIEDDAIEDTESITDIFEPDVEIEWNAAPSGNVCWDVYGPALSEIGQAPQNVAIGDGTITFGADPGALSGLLVLRDSANGSFSGFNNDFKAGEIVEVESQAAEIVTLKSRALGVYTASATFKAFTFAPIVFRMIGRPTLTFPSGVQLGMRVRRVRDSIVDVNATGASLETVELGEYFFRSEARGSATNNTAAATDQYGWALTGVQDVSLLECRGTAQRHGLAMGGSAIPNRKVRVIGGKYSLTNEAQGQAAVDCHGNAEWVEFVGVQAEGALLAGDHIKWSGGQIFGRGYGIGLRDMLGSDFEIDGVDLNVHFANPNSSRASGITFQSGATSANTTRGGHLRIKNIPHRYSGTARPAIYLVYESGFAQGATTDVTLEGIDSRLTNELAAAVSVHGLTTTAGALRSINIRNCPGVRGGGFDLRHATSYVYHNNDQSGGTDVGLLIRNSSTAATDQTLEITRSRFRDCDFSAISVLGDGTNKFVQAKIEDNDYNNVCTTNQGSAANEAAVLVQNVTTLIASGNTNPVAGANQTYSYNVASTVATAVMRHNRSVVADITLDPTTLLQEGNSWQVDSGFCHVDTTAVGNVGVGTDTLMTTSLPIGTFAKAKSGIEFEAWGTTANNSNTKTVAVLIGGQTIHSAALTVSQAGRWHIRGHVLSTGRDTQDYGTNLIETDSGSLGAPTLADQELGGLTLNDAAAFTLNLTGAVTDGGGGVNNNDIVQEGFVVKVLR